ncbi:hypothetical protein PybrP1_005041 [[Pythium] brassicae (nom. inval.)]|nr:hypothetical protein PybrP1_005041 [[Pythium] brassicae (nom. inval.)]
MAAAGITTTRTAKYVISKVGAIETSFRVAADWLACIGQCVQDEASLRVAVLSRCQHYYELQDVMLDRASTRPLLLNTDLIWRDACSEHEECSGEEPERLRSFSTDSGSSGKRSTGSAPVSIRPTKRSIPDGGAHSVFAELKQAQHQQNRDMQLLKLELQERQLNLQEAEAAARTNAQR